MKSCRKFKKTRNYGKRRENSAINIVSSQHAFQREKYPLFELQIRTQACVSNTFVTEINFSVFTPLTVF